MNLDLWKEILRQCRDYLNNQANSAELIFDKSKDNFVDLKSISKVLEELNLNQEEYEEFLKIPDDQNCQLHLKHATDSCVVNNYLGWDLLV